MTYDNFILFSSAKNSTPRASVSTEHERVSTPPRVLMRFECSVSVRGCELVAHLPISWTCIVNRNFPNNKTNVTSLFEQQSNTLNLSLYKIKLYFYLMSLLFNKLLIFTSIIYIISLPYIINLNHKLSLIDLKSKQESTNFSLSKCMLSMHLFQITVLKRILYV